MQRSSIPIRVATVQLDAHFAFEEPGVQYLGEPLREPLMAGLLKRVNPDSPLLVALERVQQHVTAAYIHGFWPRVAAVLEFCARHAVDLVVFPEYTIPGELLPRLCALAGKIGCTVVAGTHLVTTGLLADPEYLRCFTAPPPVNHAIAPVVGPTGVAYQTKLFRSNLEPAIDCGNRVEQFTCDVRGHKARFGVVICIDFMRHRDDAAAAFHREWLRDNHFLVVPSLTDKKTPQRFEASAHDVYQHFHVPVVYANLAAHGGSGVFGYGQAAGEPLAAGTAVPPLPARHEGVVIVDLQLEATAVERPTSLLHVPPAQPIAYALILEAAAEPELAAAAAALLATSDSLEFKRRAESQRAVLARAARQFADIELVQLRWRRLAAGARGIHGIPQLHGLASDLWLPADVLALASIERALVRGTYQALRGLAARPGLTEPDRQACIAVVERLERDHGALAERIASEDAIGELVVAALATAPAVPEPTAIAADGSLTPWSQDPGPPPAVLIDRGFRLVTCVTLATTAPDALDLGGYLHEIERAATWLALREAAPAWVGHSPHGTPVLVTATGHVILLAPVVPQLADLRLARASVGRLLPSALVLGDCDGWTAPRDSDVVSLEREIQKLARIESHLHELAGFEYSTARVDFIEPSARHGFSADAKPEPALALLQRWFESARPMCVVCGAPGDGRTTLLRTWLAGRARDALIREELPVLYVDGSRWRDHTHVSELLPDPSPQQRAALRLAVATGNCLLVLDGFVDIAPRSLYGHPFFAGWLTDETRLIFASSWLESPDALIRIDPPETRELVHLVRQTWADMKQQVWQLPPRDRIATAVARVDLDHPPASYMADLVLRLARPFAGLPGRDAVGAPIDLLEDLALALWSARTIGAREPRSRLRDGQLMRFIAARGDPGDSVRRALAAWQQMQQGLVWISEGPGPDAATPTWRWWRRHASLRATTTNAPSPGSGRVLWLGFAWDPLFHWLLARRVVRALAAGDATLLELPPLHADTRAYCFDQPDWPAARTHLQALLTDERRSPGVAVNALLLAVGDEALASSPTARWRLAGLDLRCLDLDRARLAYADLTRARLSGSSLASASLRGASLTEADLAACDLSDADLDEAFARAANFAGATLDGTRFVQCDLTDADLGRTVASRAPVLTDARLAGVRLCAAMWAEVPPEVAALADRARAWSLRTRTPPVILDEVLVSPVAYEGALAWAPDEHIVALSDHQGWIWLWSTGPVRCIAGRRGHNSTIRGVAYSPGGETLATAGDDTTVRLWQAHNLEPSGELRHSEAVTGVFWENDEILWSFADVPRRWRAATGELLETLAVPGVYEGRLLPGGELLALVERKLVLDQPRRGNRVFLFDRNSGTTICNQQSQTPSIAALSPDGKRMIVQSNGLSIYPFGSADSPLFRWDHNYYDRSSASTEYPLDAWSLDGRRVALIVNNRHDRMASVELWNIDAGTQQDIPGLAKVRAWGVVGSPSGRRLAAIGEAGPTILDTVTGAIAAPPEHATKYHYTASLVWTAKGLRVHSPGRVLDIDLAGSVAHRSPHEYKHDSYSLQPTRDTEGEHLVYTVVDDEYAIRDEQGRVIHLQSPPPHRSKATHGGAPQASVSPGGEYVMIQQTFAADTTSFDVWEGRTGVHRYRDLLPGRGSMLLVAAGRVHPLIDHNHGECVHLIDLERRTRLTLRTFPNSRLTVGGSGEHFVFIAPPQQIYLVSVASLVARLARLAEGEARTEELGLDAATWSAKTPINAFGCAIDESHDRLALTSPRRIELRRLSDGALLQTLVTNVGVGEVAFSPSGTHVACYWDEEITLWDLSNAARVARVVIRPQGVVLLVGGQFQRLGFARDRPPLPLDGLLGRSGVWLWPLALADESPGLGMRLHAML